MNAARLVTDHDAGSTWHRPLGRLRLPRRPRIWFELLLIAASYWIYSLVRNAAPEQTERAQRNAQWIWDVQESMGLAFERTVNHAVDSVTWLIVAMNYYYATLHFVVTILVLVWLFRSHPGRYGATRLVLFATTGVALLGYYLYPLAPPRLMNGMDFIDTVKVHETWGSMSSETMSEVSNQYAAMPSMHIGWSLWCGIVITVLSRHWWARALAVLYPAVTLVVIVATANHFWLDAVGGMLCVAFGFLVAWLWYGRLCYRLPRFVTAPAAEPGREVLDVAPEVVAATGPDRPEQPSGPTSGDRPGHGTDQRNGPPDPAESTGPGGH